MSDFQFGHPRIAEAWRLARQRSHDFYRGGGGAGGGGQGRKIILCCHERAEKIMLLLVTTGPTKFFYSATKHASGLVFLLWESEQPLLQTIEIVLLQCTA